MAQVSKFWGVRPFGKRDKGNVGINTTSPNAMLSVNGDRLYGEAEWVFNHNVNNNLDNDANNNTRQYIFSGFPNGGRMILELIVEGSFGGGAGGVSTRKFAYQFSPWSDGMYSESMATLYELGNAPHSINMSIGAVGSGAQYYVNVSNDHATDVLSNYGAHFRIYTTSVSMSNPAIVSITDK
tara:strand:- start:154 stop:699 length:546 start_codon:yes stop_codon:yes gene_type:complete